MANDVGGATAADVRSIALQSMPDPGILDVHPEELEDGFSLARWLRARSSRVGIFMLTPAFDIVNRVVGLESGADDDIARPFEPRELPARVRAILHLAGDTAAPPACLPR
jgi:DNA-binding response OmpR family regulator